MMGRSKKKERNSTDQEQIEMTEQFKPSSDSTQVQGMTIIQRFSTVPKYAELVVKPAPVPILMEQKEEDGNEKEEKEVQGEEIKEGDVINDATANDILTQSDEYNEEVTANEETIVEKEIVEADEDVVVQQPNESVLTSNTVTETHIEKTENTYSEGQTEKETTITNSITTESFTESTESPTKTDPKKDIFKNWNSTPRDNKITKQLFTTESIISEPSSSLVTDSESDIDTGNEFMKNRRIRKHHSVYVSCDRERSLSRLFGGRSLFKSPTKPLAPSSSFRSTSPKSIACISQPVRQTNPLLDEILYNLTLLESNSETLTTLDLKGSINVFTKTIGTALATSLMSNTHLKTLDLSGCGLCNVNAMEISEALRYNTSLERVSLKDNDIQPIAMRGFAEMLSVNKTLKVLEVGGQKARTGTDAEQVFARCLEKNYSLIKLGLQIKDVASRNAIDRAITRNKDMERKLRLEMKKMEVK